jgi:hypothetical protein
VRLKLVEALLGFHDASCSRPGLVEELRMLVGGDEILLASDFDAVVQRVDPPLPVPASVPMSPRRRAR